jgi:hypothetical protein
MWRHLTLIDLSFITQVSRNDVIVKGKLLQELSEGKTANPRWLVAFVDEPAWKDEELYEKAFGKQWADRDAEPPKPPPRIRTKPAITIPPKKVTTKSAASSVKGDSSSEAEGSRSSKKKSVSFTESSPPESGSDSSMKGRSAAARKSAREQRSLRRQSQDAILPPLVATGTITTKRDRAPPTNLPDSKKPRKDEEVIKVPMLTGTLYLYRGPVRRAEFVRRF